MNIEKKIDDFIICADSLPQSKGRSVNGKRVTEDYDNSYDEIYSIENCYLKDLKGNIITPIISSLEVKNDGYVITWSQLFWIQGYAVINNKIYFLTPSEENSTMYGTKGVRYWKLKNNFIGEKISFERFQKECLEIAEIPESFPESDNPFHEIGSNEHIMDKCMLFNL